MAESSRDGGRAPAESAELRRALAECAELRRALPHGAHAVLREAARFRALVALGGELGEAAAALLEDAGKHRFEWRGRAVEYWELPDAESDLLFGNVLWPCAEVLSRLLLDASDHVHNMWDDERCLSMGVTLEQLVARRCARTRSS